MAEQSLYFTAISETLKDLRKVLTSAGIEERHLHFGGELPSEGKVFVPTDARSEFLANRAMGDWAEEKLSEAISVEENLKFATVHYGDSDSTSAGDPGFKEQYLKSKEETRLYGKRPDLLLFENGIKIPNDISLLPRAEADEFARKAKVAIEVRSSKQQALKYMAVKKAESEATGKKVGKIGLSFTVKVEDLCIVYRWLEVCQIPQLYAQVFFDSVFSINVIDIFRIISSGSGFTFEKPEKSQNKATLMIPITSGKQIGSFEVQPRFDVEIRENKTGRIDPFVKPVGGELKLDSLALKEVINAI